MNKKASMQLGINAIVILIIALAILGLAMGFITKLFGSGESKLGKLIDVTELPISADSSNPLVFDSSKLRIKAGKTTELKIAVYNDLADTATVALTMNECLDDENNDVHVGSRVTFAAPSQSIPSGSQGGFGALISVNSSVEAGSIICSIKADLDEETSFSKPIFIDVYK